MRRLFLVLLILSVVGPAHADPCVDARAELKKKDYVRASIDAAACGDEALVAEVDARAEKAGWSQVDVITDPDGSTVVVEPAPDRPFKAPRRIWMAEGRYTVTGLIDGQPMVETLVVVKDGNAAGVFLTLPPPPAAPTDGTVDMGEEGGGEMSSGPPPKVELPSLLPERFQQGVDARANPLDGHPSGEPARPRSWFYGGAFVVGTVTGGADFAAGAAIFDRHRFHRERADGLALMIEAIGLATTVGEDGGNHYALRAGLDYEAHVQLGHRTWLGFAAGPWISGALGVDPLQGVALGGVGSIELVHGWGMVALRAATPMWASADEKITTFGLMVGDAW